MTLMIRILKPSCAHRTITAQQARSSLRLCEAENQAVAAAGEMSRLDASLSGNSGPSLLAHARPMQNNSSLPKRGRRAPPLQERQRANLRNRVGPETFCLPESVKKSGGQG